MSRLILGSLVVIATAITVVGQELPPNRRDITIVARDHRFSPDHIAVSEGDLVRVRLTSADQPYTFAIDAYRIVKRVGAGKTITFEFRADQPGTFPFYCNRSADEACRDMRGTLTVAPRRQEPRETAE